MDVPLNNSSLREEDSESDSLLQGSTVTSAGFNLANGALGAGVLLFPSIYSSLGLIPALLTYCLTTAIMCGALHVLSLGAFRTSQLSYQGVMRELLGKKLPSISLFIW